MRTIFLFLCICSFFLSSCVKDKDVSVEIINLKLEDADNAPVFSEYSYISLETNDDALLENIVKVELLDDDIFILSSYGGNIYHFTSSGKFVRKWLRGNGPGELIFPTDFFVDSNKKEIIVLDLYRTLKRYSFAGDFLAEEHKEIPYFSFTLHNRDTLLFDSNLSEKSANQLAVYNPKGRREYLPKNTNLKKVGFMPSNVFAQRDDEHLYVSYILSDTIYDYSFKNDTILPAYYVDIDEPSITDLSDTFFDSARDFDNMANDISEMSKLSYWNNNLFFIVYYQKKYYYAMYNMVQKTVHLYSKLSNSLLNASHYVGRNEDGIICMYTISELKSMDLLDTELKRTVLNAREEDNPILVVYDFKSNKE